MKPLEILSALLSDAAGASLPATPDAILDSPAFAMPCRLGDETAVLRATSVEPAVSDMLALSVSFGDEPHVLRLARSPRFPELDAIWDSRADVPDAILLALVERECGPLLQLLENAVRKQLRLVGVEEEGNSRRAAEGAEPQNDLFLCVSAPPRENKDDTPREEIVFSLTRSPSVVSALGALRNLDLAHESIRAQTLPSEIEYAAFQMPDADLASLAPGDAVMLPEIGAVAPRLIVAGRFVADETGVAPYQEDSLCRVRGATGLTVRLGELFDAAEGDALKIEGSKVEGCAPLKLLRQGKTVASGRLGAVGEHPAFLVET